MYHLFSSHYYKSLPCHYTTQLYLTSGVPWSDSLLKKKKIIHLLFSDIFKSPLFFAGVKSHTIHALPHFSYHLHVTPSEIPLTQNKMYPSGHLKHATYTLPCKYPESRCESKVYHATHQQLKASVQKQLCTVQHLQIHKLHTHKS